MKKTRLYFLLTALLFAGSAMAADFTPTSVYKVGDASTLQANWASKGQNVNNFVSGDTVIFQPYVCYQSAGESYQTWTGSVVGSSTTATWDATECFKGSTAWFTKDNNKAATTRTSRKYFFNVSNCVSVLFLGNPSNKSRSITANVYELGTDNKVATDSTIVKTATITGATAAVGKIEGLDGSKAYQIEVLGNDESNGQFYEIAFVKPQPLTDATLKSITINGEALEEFEPTTTTYNVVLPTGTTEVPTVEATPTAGTCTVTDATSLPGATTIEVTAKDGTTTQTYTINFTVAACAFAELALSVDSIGAIIETGDLVAPKLTNPHNLSVVYASSNEKVVTVDQTGALTKVGVGEAVITITAAKQKVEGIEYCEDEVSYKVTLTAHIIEGSTTIFEWKTVASSSTPTIPSADNISLDAEGYGTMTIGKSIVYRQFGSNAIEANKGYYKMGTDSISIECAVEGGFLAGDEITIVGKNGGSGDRNFMIGNGSATAGTTEGNIASTTQSEAKDNSTYTAVMDETNEGGVLRLFRLTGKTMYLKSIKVVRPCTVESGLVLDKTAIDVLDSEKTITAPNLYNPNELVVRYESSNAEVVAVDANTGALTKGTKPGMATITISWERQTVNFVRHCAGELVYTVTVKSGATAVENTAVAAPAVKVIRDGQLLIIREGKTYTAQGVQVQ